MSDTQLNLAQPDLRFAICLPFILQEEGGNDDDPHDPGGRTSRGILQREYNAWRKAEGETVSDVWKASDAEVAAIYEYQYWRPWCPQMTPGVDLSYFNMSVVSGSVRATIILQETLGVRADGHIGLVTLDALSSMAPIKVITDYSDTCRKFFRGLHIFKYFGRGWLNRVQFIEQAALKMLPQEVASAALPKNGKMA